MARASKTGMPTESQEQQTVMAWANYMSNGHYPELKWLHAIPNGEWRSIVTARRLKGEGVKQGVPDLCLPVARKGYHGLYLELKRKKGGQTSIAQREWIEHLTAEGYLAIVCKGAEEAITAITKYLKGE